MAFCTAALLFGSGTWVLAALVTATNNGNWSASATWTNGVQPQAGDDVIIPAGRTVTNDNQTPVLNSLTHGGTLAFIGTNNVLAATNVTVNGTFTHDIQTITNAPWQVSNCVHIVCSNLLVAAGGAIDVSAKGYGGTVGGAPGNSNCPPGYGPGGGFNWGNVGGGGAYGGAGSVGNQPGSWGGTPYGSAQVPLDAGSGGAGSYSGGTGGRGGGLLRIEATNITVNGMITAAGGISGNSAGGGAGGGIYIICRTFTGTNGTVSANGGDAALNSNGGGGGGGGRLAILYDTTAQSNLTSKPSGLVFTANGGMNAAPSKGRGRPGTLCMPDSGLLSDQFQGGQLVGFTSWAPGSLSFSNAVAMFPTGFSLSVTNGVTMIFSEFQCSGGTVSLGGNLALSATSSLVAASGPGSAFSVSSNLTLNLSTTILTNGTATNISTLSIGGSLVMTNAGTLYVHSATTNGASPDYGALVTVAGSTWLANGSWVYAFSDPTNGGSPKFQLGDLTVSSTNAGFDAAGKGFGGSVGLPPTTPCPAGYGPGGGTNSINVGGGGGYGGAGGIGNNVNALGGTTYGSAQAPIDPGSGGAGSYSGGTGGHGGGLLRIIATNVVLNGAIMADGEAGATSAGGGSGGGINIVCRTLTGTNGVLSASGGIGTPNLNGGGGGGGGRIAVAYDTVAQSNLAAKPVAMVFAANGGLSAAPTLARSRPGTIYLPDNSLLSDQFRGGQLSGFSSWAPGSLVFSNAMAAFSAGFLLSVTSDVNLSFSELQCSGGTVSIGGNLALSGTSSITVVSGPGSAFSVSSNLTLNLSTMTLTNSTATNISTLNIGGLVMTNAGRLYVYAASTNSINSNGAVVVVNGDTYLANGSWIYPYSNPTNGGSALFRLRNFTISTTNAGFDANGKGYAGGTNYAVGYGPGGGKYAVNVGGGGGYGGVGGYGWNGSVAAGGTNYGSAQTPLDPGSGGAGAYSSHKGGYGGGLIQIEAPTGRATINGTIQANGTGNDDAAGGGSGGGIYLLCRRLEGTNGVMTAVGGTSVRAANGGGGGGGGRIAVWSTFDSSTTSSWVIAVDGGTGWVYGAVGTVYWGVIRTQGTIFVVR